MVDGIRRRRLTLAVIYMNTQENSGPDHGPRHRRICSGYGNIPSQTVKYIHYKANRTAMTLGWNSQDEEDLRQDLFLEAFVNFGRHAAATVNGVLTARRFPRLILRGGDAVAWFCWISAVCVGVLLPLRLCVSLLNVVEELLRC